jgi:hypothetical protein
VAAALLARGCEVRVMDAAARYHRVGAAEIASAVDEFRPDVAFAGEAEQSVARFVDFPEGRRGMARARRTVRLVIMTRPRRIGVRSGVGRTTECAAYDFQYHTHPLPLALSARMEREPIAHDEQAVGENVSRQPGRFRHV